ncbi:MAG: CDP-alcohol phosphatidyltransferase family protein [Chitinophagaceae bacterium]|nr:CDP-alcohol phosphatidyltransferase family protein [Chitinophagaceae bacterium]
MISFRRIPDFFTLLNLFLGCLATVFVLQSGIILTETGYFDIPEKIWLGSLCIALAAVADFLDGRIARWLNQTSDMGRQLDSLADVVSFGVAPGAILYQFLRLSLAEGETALDTRFAFTLPAFVFSCAAAWRLARFNISETKKYFQGLPSPAAGLLVASLPLVYRHSGSSQIVSLILNEWFLYGFIFLLSWLMVSRIPFLSFKFSGTSLSKNMIPLAFLFISVVFIVLFRWHSPLFIFLLYFIASLALQHKFTEKNDIHHSH